MEKNYKIMVSAFEEHKEILLFERYYEDKPFTTPWQWLRENLPLFEWEPIMNDSDDFIQYEAKTIIEDDDHDGGKPNSTLLVTFIQEIKN